MKKFIVLGITCITAFILSNCSSSKKTTTTAVAKSTYEANVTPLIMSHCTPCHIPAKGGNKRAYDNYANVKADIDEIIRRIELNPGDRGFMPFKHPKLNDSTIAVFKQWKSDGMVEK